VPDSVTEFYDSLSPHYRLIFANWREAVVHHGEILDKLIRTQINISSTTSLLDCSCGIGTQAIGLALRGYRVHASDISAKVRLLAH
jgi:glycine/sarcosine N-methyltransferase